MARWMHRVDGMRRGRPDIRCVVVFALVLFLGAPFARAADTLEPFGIGATDVEFYAGYHGLGLRRLRNQSAFGELVVGYGLLERLSAIAGTMLQGNGYLAQGEGCLYFGIYGTPLDTRHLDLDLMLLVHGGGRSFGQFRMVPSFELNIDRHPDMRSWGFYLRGGAALEGSSSEEEQAGDSIRCRMGVGLEALVGAYLRLRRRHQLLLELDGLVRLRPSVGERRWELGALALGYNVSLSDRIELIHHVYLDLPQEGHERPVAGFYVGFIVSLPAAASPSP